MKRYVSTICLIMSFSFLFCSVSCNKKDSSKPENSTQIEDKRNITDFEYARNSISSVDALGRVTLSGDGEESRDVGLFYFLWLGAHARGNKIYNISDLEENNPDALWSEDDVESPYGTYHFWGEPLYGYYHSADPWVITKHVELFTMAGIDYLLFDVTNTVTYDNVIETLLPILDKYQKQGWDVPKIGFMTNTSSYGVINRVYQSYYNEQTSKCYYPNLWYSPNGKPLILGDTMYFDENKESDMEILNFFQIRPTQWPNTPYQDEEAFPWMDWTYPQLNHDGTISVSVAQHTLSKMSLKDGNWGRGFSQVDFLNNSNRINEGSNFQCQWNTALNSLKNQDNKIDNVFVTGWNEWIAIKFADANGVYFVDTFNEEYSRDIEMMKGGYGDNYYLQLFNNIRAFKYLEPVNYILPSKTIESEEDWKNVRSYPDFVGEAINRDYQNYLGTERLVDNTARNDIASVKVIHDKTNMYFCIETKDNITDYELGDTNWMNLWIATTSNGIGFDYVVNNQYGKLSKIVNGKYESIMDCDMSINGKYMYITIPLNAINRQDDVSIRFKVSDNVDSSDVMNFYIQGDSAPIGRMTYTYGYFKK